MPDEIFAQMTTEEVVRGLAIRWHERAEGLSRLADEGDPEHRTTLLGVAFAYRAAATGLLMIAHTLDVEDRMPEVPSGGLHPKGRPGYQR